MRTCNVCQVRFRPVRPMQSVCSPGCAIKEVGIKRDKAAAKALAKAAAEDRRQTRAALAKIKPRAQWLAECQAIVNKMARLRDVHRGCVSCDRPASWNGQWHASHLRSVGAASAVRFHLWNINKSCSICNNHLSGNIGSYLPRLRERIGNEKVDWLYQQNKVVRHDINYLRRFKIVMSQRLRRLSARAP